MCNLKLASVPITACRLHSGSGWNNPTAETATPGPSLHESELNFSIPNGIYGQEGGQDHAEYRKAQRPPSFLEGPHQRDTTSEKRSGQLSCLTVRVNEKGALTSPLHPQQDQTRRSLMLGLGPSAVCLPFPSPPTHPREGIPARTSGRR